jgi:phospholipid/cholesterol/gamma-HCH transport system permease protein
MQPASFEAHPDSAQQCLTLVFRGDLTIHQVSALWEQCFQACQQADLGHIVVQCADIQRCDSAGMSLLVELRQEQVAQKRTVAFEGMSVSLQEKLTAMFSDVERSRVREQAEHGFAAGVGQYAVNVVSQMRQSIVFTGELACRFFQICMRPQSLRWKDVWKVMETSGPNALPIIALLGFLVGLILSFQAIVQLQKFGVDIFVVNLVGIGLTRELAPLLTGVIIAGRTASSFAAEIGTMKINQELDALTTMGLSPMRFLTMPRVVAVTLMTPFLSIFMIFFGLLGCGLFMRSLGYPWAIFLKQLYSAVSLGDFWGGCAKALVFGFMVAAIGCLHGLKTRFGASAVGRSTTQAVVSAIIMLVVVDGVFSIVFYLAGL